MSAIFWFGNIYTVFCRGVFIIHNIEISESRLKHSDQFFQTKDVQQLTHVFLLQVCVILVYLLLSVYTYLCNSEQVLSVSF